jgi:FKBP-type peptidyl-prolyl cis-trans isomerase
LLWCQAGCQRPLWKQQTKGFEIYEDASFWYQWFGEDKQSRKPQEGEQVWIDYAICKGDSILNSSFGQTDPILVQIPAPQFSNFFTNALQLMGEGDSLQVKVKAATIPELLGDYALLFEEEEALVDFRFKLYEIKSKTSVEAEETAQTKQLAAVEQKIKETIVSYQKKEITLPKTKTGLEHLIYNKGGEPSVMVGDEVAMHYLCYDQDGTKIDESFDDMVPLKFKVGSNAIIDGISQGVLLLGEGGAAFLAVPPELAYGEEGSPPTIAPHSQLFFYIELINISKD